MSFFAKLFRGGNQPDQHPTTTASPPASYSGHPDIATASVTRAFDRHIQMLQLQLRGEPETLAALNKVVAVFHQTANTVGEKISSTAADAQMHSFSFRDNREKIRLEVTTIPCAPQEARDYFARIPPGEYSEFLTQLLYCPEVYRPARAEGIQVFAHVVVVVDAKSRRDPFLSDQVVIHLCVLPHGDGNQRYCPVGVTPTDLLNK